ncbi:MAG: DUF2784 domain-containing protein [Candidatus Binataceae bacterium]
MHIYGMLADGVVIVHAAYVGFVVIGFALILIGGASGWRWVRSFWFRMAHLAAIAFVCAEALTGVICPLTTLEDWLRVRAGQFGYSNDFVGYWVDRLIFYNFPPWIFVVCYAAFALAVAAALVAVPPRWRAPRGSMRHRQTLS